jgi:ATP-dependent Lon protease
LPDHVRQEMHFHFVDRVEQVLSIVIPNLQMVPLALAS